MAKRKQTGPRPFQREALDEYVVPDLRIRMGPGETVWRYTLTVPLEEIRPLKRQKATAEDLENLERMFIEHFRGCTRLPDSLGFGLRDPNDPSQPPETNLNAFYVVLTSPLLEADAYFRALRRELEVALDEGVILVERQEEWIP
jgi:hypothetical protein